ncbi:NAD(P)-dependent oxidoreductase [Lacticaseibacillus kribbianus]|uniref:NAD(P)-dependent oxidoreductase n=1 Tax=Lacticaseibacillus kribbianus TaxID=2926292 RepID=UPI001CD337FB|nr:NAD(P)-dependent oxidoreductase [Lacticaseibacillus kribbianus]
MRIAAFGVREAERPYFAHWAKATGDQLALHSELLTPTTVSLAAGAQAITCFQTVPYAPGVFAGMAALNLHYLALRNTGTDNVDFAAAKRHGVHVSNVPAYSPAAIAEFAIADMLYLLRHTGAVQADLHRGDYPAAALHLGRELNACTVGVVGTGRIGRALIRLLNGFGATVLTTDTHRQPIAGLRYTAVPLPELLAQSDIVTLHIPGTPENTHLIDTNALARMRRGALLINTGRPNLVDTRALIAALQSGHIGGAGIDTYENETADLLALDRRGHFNDPQWQALLAQPNVVLSPHIAYYTATAVQNMVETALTCLHDFVQTNESALEVAGQ